MHFKIFSQFNLRKGFCDFLNDQLNFQKRYRCSKTICICKLFVNYFYSYDEATLFGVKFDSSFIKSFNQKTLKTWHHDSNDKKHKH